MPSKGGNFLHFRVLPYIDLVEGKAMCRDELVESFTENQVTNLGPSVNRFNRSPLEGISKLYSLICSPST